jgi:hypothetical protein
MISYAAHSGEAPPDQFTACLRLAMDACLTVYGDMRACLADSAKRKLAHVGGAAQDGAGNFAGSSGAVGIAAVVAAH